MNSIISQNVGTLESVQEIDLVKLRQSAKEASTMVDAFRGREGFHNALVLKGLAKYAPISVKDLAKKIDVDQTVVFRRLKDLKDRWCVGEMKDLMKNGRHRNTYRLTWEGLRSCAFLDLDERVLETAELCDPLNDIIESKESREEEFKHSGDPIPLKFKLQIEFMLLQIPDIYSMMRWGKEWLKAKKKLEHKLGKEKLGKWLSDTALEDVMETFDWTLHNKTKKRLGQLWEFRSRRKGYGNRY
jgi:predicted transcriptional regulator